MSDAFRRGALSDQTALASVTPIGAPALPASRRGDTPAPDSKHGLGGGAAARRR